MSDRSGVIRNNALHGKPAFGLRYSSKSNFRRTVASPPSPFSRTIRVQPVVAPH